MKSIRGGGETYLKSIRGGEGETYLKSIRGGEGETYLKSIRGGGETYLKSIRGGGGGLWLGAPLLPGSPCGPRRRGAENFEASIFLAPKAPKQNFGCEPQTLEGEEGGEGGGWHKASVSDCLPLALGWGGVTPPPPAVYGRSKTSPPAPPPPPIRWLSSRRMRCAPAALPAPGGWGLGHIDMPRSCAGVALRGMDEAPPDLHGPSATGIGALRSGSAVHQGAPDRPPTSHSPPPPPAEFALRGGGSSGGGGGCGGTPPPPAGDPELLEPKKFFGLN